MTRILQCSCALALLVTACASGPRPVAYRTDLAQQRTTLPGQPKPMPKLVAVLPLDLKNAKLDDAARQAIEESIRTAAGDVLVERGFTVLTGETTLRLLEENGIDLTKTCEASCGLDAARDIKADVFVSGSISTTEGVHVGFVRVFRVSDGNIIASAQFEGTTANDMRRAFESRALEMYTKAADTMSQGPRR